MKTQKRRSLRNKRSFKKRRATQCKKNNTKNKHKYFLVKYTQKGGAITCGEKLGSGAYGIVYKCIDGDTIIGVKKILTHRNHKAEAEFNKEIEIMEKLHGKYKDYILQYITYESIEGKSNMLSRPLLYYYSEYCDLGSLAYYVISNEYREKEEAQRPYILKHILQGLCYLFDESIIHSDIHIGNILVQQSGNKIICKIADFGKGSILGKEGKLDLTELPFGPSATPMYLHYSTYFRDLHAWFIILLNFYNNFETCDGYTGSNTILYPINFGVEIEKNLIKLFYELGNVLLVRGYSGYGNKSYHKILNTKNEYKLNDEKCVVTDKPVSGAKNVLQPLPPLPPLPQLPSEQGSVANNELPLPPLPQLPSEPVSGANNDLSPSTIIDIQTDRAIYEPVYQEIKKILQIA